MSRVYESSGVEYAGGALSVPRLYHLCHPIRWSSRCSVPLAFGSSVTVSEAKSHLRSQRSGGADGPWARRAQPRHPQRPGALRPDSESETRGLGSGQPRDRSRPHSESDLQESFRLLLYYTSNSTGSSTTVALQCAVRHRHRWCVRWRCGGDRGPPRDRS